jgi:hypothetical protein
MKRLFDLAAGDCATLTACAGKTMWRSKSIFIKTRLAPAQLQIPAMSLTKNGYEQLILGLLKIFNL